MDMLLPGTLKTLEVAETKISRVLLPSWKGDDDEINYVL